MASLQKLTYLCPCLNVRLQFKEPVQLVPRVTSPRDEYDDELDDANQNGRDTFFKHAIIVISSPNGVEITTKVDCLCHGREVDDWQVTTCANCGTDTHATKNDDTTMVYVSDEMQNDTSSAQTQLSYSPVYGIVVFPFTSNEVHLNVFGMSSFSERPIVREKLEELKQKASRFLDEEQEAMNERIRNFKKEQLFNFKEMESRVEHDQNVLMQRVRSVVDKYDRSKEPSAVRLVASMNEASPKSGRLASRTAEKSLNDEVARSFGPQSSFDVFAMDEDDVFSLSEPDSSDSQEDCPSDDAPRSTVDVNSRLYAASLPISMPMMWKRSIPERQIDKNEDESSPSEKDDFKTDDPQWMAASIQALAISVRGNDGTEMFGARPRPRLNTLD